MPSLSFDSENGKAIAYIKVSKEELKAKPELKTYNNQIIYLHDNNDGVKEIEFDDLSIFPLFKFKEGEKQINRINIQGKSGSGKTTLVGKMLDTMLSKRHGNPDKEIVIISGIDSDDPLDKPRGPKGNKKLPERIDIYDPEFGDMTEKDFENCIVCFDDCENLTNKAVSRVVLNLRNALLEKGRHSNADVISISHNPLSGSITRFVHSEATAFVVFPAFAQVHQLNTYLKKYAGLSKQTIEKIINLGETKSRWIYVNNLAPCYVIYQKGIFLVR